MTRRLIADIGGTNARFALAEGGAPGPMLRLLCADYSSFDDALGDALARMPEAASAREVAIAAAGPVAQGAIDVTNLPWRIEAEAVAARLGGAAVRLVNDLEAVGLALPHLTDGDMAPLRAAAAPPERRPMIAINVGSGFGAAAAVPVGENWTALAGEPGHMRFAAANPPEWEQMAHLGSVEDVLSGRGLTALYNRLGGSQAADAAGVFHAVANEPAARTAVDIFAGVLGRVAGDLVLATGAWGGAWLCGGLVCRPRGARFESAFLEAFDAKGAMAARIARVPVFRITAANPALQGLAAIPF